MPEFFHYHFGVGGAVFLPESFLVDQHEGWENLRLLFLRFFDDLDEDVVLRWSVWLLVLFYVDCVVCVVHF